jgi:hypothetical protein
MQTIKGGDEKLSYIGEGGLIVVSDPRPPPPPGGAKAGIRGGSGSFNNSNY